MKRVLSCVLARGSPEKVNSRQYEAKALSSKIQRWPEILRVGQDRSCAESRAFAMRASAGLGVLSHSPRWLDCSEAACQGRQQLAVTVKSRGSLTADFDQHGPHIACEVPCLAS